MQNTWPVSNKKFEEHVVDPQAHDVRFNAIEADYEAQIATERGRISALDSDLRSAIKTETERAEGVEAELEKARDSIISTISRIDEEQSTGLSALNKLITEEIDRATAAELSNSTAIGNHINNTEVHVTADMKNYWDDGVTIARDHAIIDNTNTTRHGVLNYYRRLILRCRAVAAYNVKWASSSAFMLAADGSITTDETLASVVVSAPATGRPGYETVNVGSTGYTRVVTTNVYGCFVLNDGSNGIGLCCGDKDSNGNDYYVAIPVGLTTGSLSIQIPVKPGDKIIVRSASDTGSENDPNCLMFIPYAVM